MIKIKDKKKFSVFLIVLCCFVFSGFYLIKKIGELKNSNGNKELVANDPAYQEGVSQLSEGNFEEASKILEQSLEEDAKNSEKLKMLAISQYNQKNYDEAEKNFKKLLKEDKKNDYVYYNSLANVYRDQERYDEAAEYYEKSIKANEKYETAYQQLIFLYQGMVDPPELEKAQEVIERGLENIPESEILKKMKQ